MAEERRGGFHGALAQLQRFHETEVASIRAEVVRLRTELEANKPAAEASCKAATSRPQPAGDSPDPGGPSHAVASADGLQRQQSMQRQQSALSVAARTTSHAVASAGGLQRQQSALSVASRMRQSAQPHVSASADGPPRRQFEHLVRRMSGPSGQSIRQLRMARSVSSIRESIRSFESQKGWRGACKQLLHRQSFNAFIGLIIALNAVFIGTESSIARSGQETPTAVNAMECLFVSVYIVELAIRLVAHGIKALAGHWTQFDVLLAICGLLGVASKLSFFTQRSSHAVDEVRHSGGRHATVFPPCHRMTGEYISILGKVLLLRILRLARLARISRVMTKFSTLWLLVQELMNSLPTLVWTGTFIGILLYVFSVLGLELLLPYSQASEEYSHAVTGHFGSLFAAMLTLLQGLTVDSFSSIYRPIIQENPYTVLYFVPFLLTVSIALMNLVTAVMENLSLEQAAKDKEAQEQVQMERKGVLANLLLDMIIEVDADGSKRIDLTEMMSVPSELKSLVLEIANIGKPGSDCQHDLQDIFQILDFESSGDVEIGEFVGLLKLHNDKGPDAMRFHKQCKSMMTELLSAVANLAPTRSSSKSLAALSDWCASGQDGMPSVQGPAMDTCSVELRATPPVNNDREDFLQV